jgi:hypothetical protein
MQDGFSRLWASHGLPAPAPRPPTRRRFQPVMVPEPSVDEAHEILCGTCGVAGGGGRGWHARTAGSSTRTMWMEDGVQTCLAAWLRGDESGRPSLTAGSGRLAAAPAAGHYGKRPQGQPPTALGRDETGNLPPYVPAAGLRDRYEAHHKLRYTDGALLAAAKMASQYIT